MRQRMFVTSLSCQCCRTVAHIVRRQSRTQQSGHIKHLWCFRCKKRTQHIEFISKYELRENA